MRQYFRALTLYRRGQVKLVSELPSALFFEVNEYSVFWSEAKEQWSCTCEYSSLWSRQKKDCSHVKSARIYLENMKKQRQKRQGGVFE